MYLAVSFLHTVVSSDAKAALGVEATVVVGMLRFRFTWKETVL